MGIYLAEKENFSTFVAQNQYIIIMKKIFLTAFVALMATVSVCAQHEDGDLLYQPRVGITLSTLSGMDDAKMKVNVTYGVECEYFFDDDFSIAGGVLFTDQGAKFNQTDGDYTMKIYYVAFPFTLNYYVLPGLALKAGVQPAYRVKAQMVVGSEKVDFDRAVDVLLGDEGAKMNKFDLAIPVGLSYEYNHITLDARYNFGITKLFSNSDDTVRNQVVAVTLGYKF